MTIDIATLAIRVDSTEARTAARDMDQMGNAGGRAERSTNALSGVVKGLGAALAVLKILDFAKDAAMLAARYETLGVTMRVAGNNAGYTNAQMQAFQKTLQETGISMTQSRNSLIQLATANLDLAKSQELARTAQNLAVVANINSSEALESLIHGIKSAETEVLQTLGLNVKFEAGYKTLAAQLGTTSDKLTEHQKLVARTNLVLGEAAKYNGIYEESLSTAGKALGSLSRYWEDFQVKAGEVFLPALTDAVFKLTGALKEMNAAADDAKQIGDLEAIGRGLGAAFKYAYEAVAILAANFVFTFATIGREIGAMAAAAGAAARGDFSLIPGIFKAADEASAAARAGLDAFEKKILDTADATVKLADKNKLSAEQMEAARIAAGKASRDKQEADERALKAAEEADKARKKAAADYESAIKSANEFIVALKIETSEIGLGADQVKMMAAARAAAKAPTAELRMAIMTNALALDIETKAFAASEAAKKSVADATQVLVDSRAGEYMAIAAEVQANKDAIATYGLSKSAIEALTLARMEDRLARRGPQDLDLDEAEANHLTRMIALQKEKAATATTLGLMDTGNDVAKAKELLDILVAVDNAAKQAAQGMTESFGRVGSAIGGLTTSLTGYAVQQRAIAAQLASAKFDAKGDTAKIDKANAAAAQQSAQAQMKSYGDMAGAAKGFFKESTAGYKVLQTTEKAFRAVEMAMAIENTLRKSGLLEAFTGLFVASKATETAADTTATGASVVNSGIRAAADGVAAFAKTLASIPFPFNVAAGAAVVALLAGMGVKIAGGGGGGGVSAAQRQESQGTGSILGDSSAKSDSIARSIELAATNSSIELTHTAGMLASLKAIENSISGLGNLLVRGTDVTSLAGNVAATSSGGFFGNIMSSIFGGKTTVQDTGVMIGRGSIADIAAGGINSQSYVDTKKSGGWFSSSKYNTSTKDLGAEVDDQFAKVILSLSTSVKTAAGLLGVGGDAFTTKLNSFVVDIGKISLKDLKGEEIQAALEAVFSKLGDDMAQFGVAGLEQFQQVGEGYFETLTRVATNYANLNSIMESIGTTFGATGMTSIAARENLIALAGGIDELAGQTSSFATNFLSQAEQLAPVQKYVNDQLAAMGLQGIDTRDKFKDVVLGLANSGALATEAGAKQYTSLLALADAFAKTHAATEDLTRSEQDIADERTDLRNQLDELTLTQAQLAEKARAAIDPYNRALYDQVIAAQAAKDSLAETSSILDLQAQIYAANGNAAGAAAVLEQQHAAALLEMTPALAAANKELWAAQAAATAQAKALTLSNGNLANMASYYGAIGDKAGAADVASQQWIATLAAMEPALRASATVAHDAQLAEKARTDALAINNSILANQATYYEAVGDKTGAANVAALQWIATLAAMDPALRDSATLAHNAQLAEKARADKLTESNSLLEIQAQIYELTGNKAGAAAVLQRQHAAALALLSPTLQQATKDLWAAQDAAAGKESTLNYFNSIADILNKSGEAARSAAKSLEEFNKSLLAGPDSILSPEQQYAAAQAGFQTADAAGLKDAASALLNASKAWFGGGVGYAADFAAVLARTTSVAATQNAYADNVPRSIADMYDRLGINGAHANGGIASGWSLVGEQGPEIVNFDQPARVYTASQSREMMGGGRSSATEETNKLLREVIARQDAVITELRGATAQRGAVGVATVEGLQNLARKADDNKRVVRAAGAGAVKL